MRSSTISSSITATRKRLLHLPQPLRQRRMRRRRGTVAMPMAPASASLLQRTDALRRELIGQERKRVRGWKENGANPGIFFADQIRFQTAIWVQRAVAFCGPAKFFFAPSVVSIVRVSEPWSPGGLSLVRGVTGPFAAWPFGLSWCVDCCWLQRLPIRRLQRFCPPPSLTCGEREGGCERGKQIERWAGEAERIEKACAAARRSATASKHREA